MASRGQMEFFPAKTDLALPGRYAPRPPKGFRVERIVLTCGSVATADREAFVRRICGVYPHAAVEERLDVPHNRVALSEADPLQRQELGKRTLVFGAAVPSSAVRCTEVEDPERPYRWHFSVYGYCFHECAYCYLAGTDGVWHSPTVKVYVNVCEIVEEIDRQSNRQRAPTSFYLGKLQDGLALDPLTAYSTALVPFFGEHRYARLLIQTKSASVERLLGLKHNGHTTLSWSLNPPKICRLYDKNAPSLDERVAAMQRCVEAGYRVKALIQPFIPHGNWEATYGDFVCMILERVPTVELAIAGMCIGKRALSLLERRKGRNNVISRNLSRWRDGAHGATYYCPSLERRLFEAISCEVRRRWPGARLTFGMHHPSELQTLRVQL